MEGAGRRGAGLSQNPADSARASVPGGAQPCRCRRASSPSRASRAACPAFHGAAQDRRRQLRKPPHGENSGPGAKSMPSAMAAWNSSTLSNGSGSASHSTNPPCGSEIRVPAGSARGRRRSASASGWPAPGGRRACGAHSRHFPGSAPAPPATGARSSAYRCISATRRWRGSGRLRPSRRAGRGRHSWSVTRSTAHCRRYRTP